MRTFMVLVVFLSVDCTVYGDCPSPTLGPNMMLGTDLTFPAPEGTSVSLDCEVGYRRVGPSTIVCSGGQWTRINMICEKRNCGSAGEVTNGHVDYSQGTEFGAYIIVVCDEGFEPVGSTKIFCGVNGWMDRLAECEAVVCDAPNPITNGQFSPVKDDYQHSEIIEYSCNGEYKLNGSSTAICENRQFKPGPPTCVLVNCPDPVVVNGVAAGGSRPPYKHLDSVTFKCNVGYNMVGRDTVSCDINSNWSPAFPKCNPVECKAPVILNGEVVDGPRLTYKFSEKITLKCSEGYDLKGERILTCGERDQWLPAVPECTLIQCQTPQVAGGVLVGGSRPSYKYSDTVVFKCTLGHNLSGKDTVKCDANGQWSPKLPQCTPVMCKTPEVKDGLLVRGSQSSYKYSDSVVFKCKDGYTMSGESTLQCGLNSQWSPDLPQCTRNDGNTSKTVGIVFGVLAAVAALAIGVYFGLRKKKKGAGKPYTEAPQDAENLALS